jgi:hypothetical protein
MVTQQDEWYVQKGSRVQGPFSPEEVGRFLLLGRVRNTDRVSRDGQLWEPVTQVPELIPEELLDLESETGWERFLDSHSAADERGAVRADGSRSERRATDASTPQERVRDAWLSSPAEHPLSSRVLPWSLLGITMAALCVALWLNSTATPGV